MGPSLAFSVQRWGMRRLLLVTLLPLALLACSGDDDDPDATTTSSTERSTTTSTTEAPTTTSTTAFEGSTTPTSITGDAAAVAHLTAVRVAGQEGFDRVVFELDGEGAPNVAVGWVDAAVADGSGERVEVEGDALLEVRMEPASGVDLNGEEVRETYTGPDRVRGDTTSVTEVVRTGDFEANLTWVIGVERELPYRVSVLREPSRIVVEVAGSPS